MSSGKLDGKVAIVTGASRGLGRAIAAGLAAAGCTVMVTSRKAEASAAVAAQIRTDGGNATSFPCHVGNWDDCAALVSATVAQFGKVDILVNNAGIAPVSESLESLSETLIDKTLAVNFKGPLRLIGLCAPHMSPGSSVINISSRASTQPSPTTLVYAAAKAALNAATVANAQELGPRGIRVNALVCGPFRTQSFQRALDTHVDEQALVSRIPLRRIGEPHEVVGSVLWLASAASSYVTGALISLDGGS